ncbi:MAG: phenylacetate--CoA ligase family protein [Candidatus Zixiibacteriota bacterium]|nr:MAG: phenylacetate--CoA ligase family protein [candidate division Zixibacteria bacterium]
MNRTLENIYNLSPAVFQNACVSLYGLKLYFREYGKKFHRLLDKFEKMQWYSYEDLKEYQDKKLIGLVKHCYENVPYYRKVMDKNSIKPSDIQTVDDLHKFPVLTRKDIKNNFSSLIAKNYRRSELTIGHTSGTTGSPLEFLYDRRICLVKNVTDWRQKRWAGINPGDKIAFFLGRVVVPITRKKPPFWRSNWIMNHKFFSSFHLSGENIDTYIEELERFKPAALEGYPSTVYIIARFLLSRNKTLPLKAAFTSSETLYPQQREAIEKAFECELFDFYGLAERVIFATECAAHEGHHLNMDFGITEVVDKDDQPVNRGELGRIIATGLHNFGMPLIRYKTGDITALKPDKCSCGRNFPLMEDVTTKAEDIITTYDGRLISSSILTHPFKPMHNIAESQIIQEDLKNIRIKIVRLPKYSEEDTRYLTSELGKRLGGDMEIHVEYVDSIPRTKAGKFRWVISKVPLEF